MAVITGTNAHEKLFGTGDADQISGLDGKDEIFAGAGDDSVTGGLGNDVIDGGSGTDTAIYAGDVWNYTVIQDWQGNLYVSTGDPGLIVGTGMDPNVGEGTDRLISVEKASFNGVIYDLASLVQASKQYGKATNDYIVAPLAFSESVLIGNGGNDTLIGHAGTQDSLYGGAGDDSLVGNGGRDVLDGGTGADYMEGGEGVTHYYVDDAGDVVVDTGSAPVGNIHNKLSDLIYSTVSYDAVAGVEVLDFLGTADVNSNGNAEANTIKGNAGNNVINGLLGDDTLRGRGGDDTITGGDGDDYIEGNDGNDSLEGGNDHDRLSGGNGADTMVGGHGNDVVGGGAGADDFVFSSVAINGHDHVTDFQHGLDRLVFTGADYGFAAGHVLMAAEFTVGSVAVGAGAQFVWDSAAHKLWWDADGNGAGAAFELAIVSGSNVTKDDLFFT